MLLDSLSSLNTDRQTNFFDLASGYPHQNLLSQEDRRSIGRIVSEALFKGSTTSMKQDALWEIGQLLGFNHEDRLDIRVFPNASLALYVLLRSLKLRAERRGAATNFLICPLPAFDVPIHFAQQLGFNIIHPSSLKPNELPTAEAISDSVKSAPAFANLTLLLTSPNNPNGYVWTFEELSMLMKVCETRGAHLILDHCFLHAGTHRDTEVAKIWDAAGEMSNFSAVWDTGKTLQFNGLKLACFISKDADLCEVLQSEALYIDYQQSLHLALVFARLFQSGHYSSFSEHLRNVSQQNERTLLGTESVFSVLPSGLGGTQRLVRLSDDLRHISLGSLLQEAEVQMVDGAVFQMGKASDYARLSLARPVDYFSDALARIHEVAIKSA